jgi:hypothetical protein
MGLFAPVFYGVFGFIFGALGAFPYSLMAKWLGGIEVQVQASRKNGISTRPRMAYIAPVIFAADKTLTDLMVCIAPNPFPR